MRIRLDSTCEHYVTEFGRRTGRSASNAAALLISLTPLPEIEQHVVEHGNGVTISARVRGELSEALRKYAAAESRSLSSVMKRILRQRLAELGYMNSTALSPDNVTSDAA